MTNQDCDTLAYTKSPKTSKRTTFQDELQAAVFARARKTKPTQNQYSYLDDFSDDDGLFGELLKSRKKRADAFKTGRSKGKINDFDLSDDEQKDAQTKRVSFLKSRRITSTLEDTVASESNENEPLNSYAEGHSDQKSLFSLQSSTNECEGNITHTKSVVESSNTQDIAENPDESPSNQNPEDTELNLALTLLSNTYVIEPSVPLVCESTEEKNKMCHEESSHLFTDSVSEGEPPKPKPRQRTFKLTPHPVEKQGGDSEAQDLCKPQTSTAAVPPSSSSINNRAEGDHRTSKSFSNGSEQSQLFIKSTADSGSPDVAICGGDKEHERKYSTSFEDLNKDSGEHSADQLSHIHEETINSKTSGCSSKASQRSRSVCSNKTESKYLGTLKILDSKLSLHESQLQTADSLRAAIYQEWVKKKEENIRKNAQLRKQQEEKRKKEQEAKKEEAVVSFEAWKKKKAESLKAKAKEKQELVRKEQMAVQEREEKRESAKQVFEKWKHEHDQLLKEKFRKQQIAENKLQLKTQQKEEEKRGESKIAFSRWCEKKKNVLDKKAMREHEEIKTKEEEERYQREERDALALEMYEKWLARKSQQENRQREDKYVREILQDSPHPPWNPPNKTIPFRR
ncbi:microtubule-associated protein 9 [Thalassophryne amazonica]|uniref:microtubule-associated protein 9 n=1 Tax=Thalassophryne amazonica TaxID=390379 RepID=UPI001471C5B3|nr:microtubule-associated protein 9 [Thalassophryne amazonica]